MHRKNRKGFAPILVFALTVIAGISLIVATQFILPGMPGGSQAELKKFSSCSQIQSFLEENSGSYGGLYNAISGTTGMMRDGVMAPQAMGGEKAADSTAGAEDYSATNVQVAGVDEPDMVKNDGKYIYTVSGSMVFIIDAYPAESGKILSSIDSPGISQIFVNGDRLVAFGVEYPTYTDYGIAEKIGIAAPRYYSYSPTTYIHVYDVSDRSTPILQRNISIDGSYADARMIGDYVYAVVNKGVEYVQDQPVPMPMIRSEGVTKPACGCTDLYYFDVPDYGYQFVTIASLNIMNDAAEPQTKVIMSGYTDNMFVSASNIYLSYMKRMSMWEQTDRLIDAAKPLLPAGVSLQITQIQNSDSSRTEKMQQIAEVFQDYYNSLSEDEKQDLMARFEEALQKVYEDLAKETQKTVIHKISIDNGNIEYKTKGEVSGRLLNQFSMDESQGFLRVATTIDPVWTRSGESSKSSNNVYVMDAGMAVIGSLEGLAPGESIYSARFMGDRGYLVTFKKIDPLFVIDLSDPANPSLLGKLKIPGYSDYLHPYDDTHIIGIGKEAVDAEGEFRDFAWYQGVKLALFDVSDPENPKEISKYVIGDRGTDSYALQDHKAFLFSKDRSLLVIPIQLAEIDRDKYPGEIPANAYGDFTFQGAYVFSLDLSGFQLKGRVTHAEPETLEKSGWYWYSDSSVQRSLYMGDNLYTVSQTMVKANSLADLSELKAIKLPVEQPPVYPLYEDVLPARI
jgi:inhibitor of cysteine peptidase